MSGEVRPIKFYYAFIPRDYVVVNGSKRYLWSFTRAFDGLLLSRAYVNGGLEKQMRASGGVKAFFGIPSDVEVVSDSGAFTWKHLDKPPMKPLELLEYYYENRFDAGMHPDHICRPMKFTVKEGGVKKLYEITLEDARERFAVSLEMARETAKLLDENSTYKGVRIYGVAQGWSPESYLESVKELLGMGYRYVAVGGLALARTREVARTMKVIMGYINERRKSGEKITVHLLGVGRLSLIPLLRELRVDSFDSATWLRSSWTRGAWFYYNRYTGQLVNLTVKPFDPHRYGYHRDPPLPRCDCPVCREVGVDEEGVVWTRRYRGNQRNMSRGFHNMVMFYEWLKNSGSVNARPSGRVLVVTHCAAKKIGTPAPPQRLYVSPRIRKVYEAASSAGAVFGVLSAKYGLVLQDEVIEPYDKKMESGEDVDNVVSLTVEKLRKSGPWDWLVYFGAAKNYVTAFFSAAVAAGYEQRTLVISSANVEDLRKVIGAMNIRRLDEFF